VPYLVKWVRIKEHHQELQVWISLSKMITRKFLSAQEDKNSQNSICYSAVYLKRKEGTMGKTTGNVSQRENLPSWTSFD